MGNDHLKRVQFKDLIPGDCFYRFTEAGPWEKTDPGKFQGKAFNAVLRRGELFIDRALIKDLAFVTHDTSIPNRRRPLLT